MENCSALKESFCFFWAVTGLQRSRWTSHTQQRFALSVPRRNFMEVADVTIKDMSPPVEITGNSNITYRLLAWRLKNDLPLRVRPMQPTWSGLQPPYLYTCGFFYRRELEAGYHSTSSTHSLTSRVPAGTVSKHMLHRISTNIAMP